MKKLFNLYSIILLVTFLSIHSYGQVIGINTINSTGVNFSGNPTGVGINSKAELIVFHRANRTWPLLGSMPKDPIKLYVQTEQPAAYDGLKEILLKQLKR